MYTKRYFGDDDDDDDDDDVTHLHWQTDGKVSVDGDKQDEPDCRGLCDRR